MGKIVYNRSRYGEIVYNLTDLVMANMVYNLTDLGMGKKSILLNRSR